MDTTMQQVDWTKVSLLMLVIAGAGYMAKDSVTLPEMAEPPRSIPAPNAANRQAVQQLEAAKLHNPRAARLLGQFFADFAWLIEHGEKATYTTGELELQLNEGGRRLLAMKSEVGESNLSPAINSALNAMWGSSTSQIAKHEASQVIYAMAWAMR